MVEFPLDPPLYGSTMHTPTHTNTHPHTPTHTPTHTYTHAHTHNYNYTHTNTHTHARTSYIRVDIRLAMEFSSRIETTVVTWLGWANCPSLRLTPPSVRDPRPVDTTEDTLLSRGFSAWSSLAGWVLGCVAACLPGWQSQTDRRLRHMAKRNGALSTDRRRYIISP